MGEEIQSNTKFEGMDDLISSSSKFLDRFKDFKSIQLPLLKKEEEDLKDKSCFSSSGCIEDDNSDESVLCVSGSKLVRTGFEKFNSSENILKFVNAGGEAVQEVGDFHNFIMPDNSFEGGDVLRTDETILEGGCFASLYQSARFGNFCYCFDNLSSGDYFVDLHFAEIINTNGPKGMRVFDVFVQEEKVVSELDVYSIVGTNRPLQLIDIRVTVGLNGVLLIKFEGVHGSPIISGICIKEAPKLPESQLQDGGSLCDSCASHSASTSVQYNNLRATYISKYEKKIEELSTRCQLKTNECYEAWMALTSLNKQLEEANMELDNKSFQNHCLDQAMALQATKIRDASSMYEHEKNLWFSAIDELEKKIKIMKQEQAQLSLDAHECANSIPDLHKMISAVQGLVAQCDDLKLKYSEELMKRKKLYNQIQEAKGNIRVFCRCRPLSKDEVSAGFATILDFDAAKDGDLGILTGGSNKKLYKFDRVYTPKDDQVDVFADASPLAISVLDGYNVCIFAYGQTGTGKTYTMEGTEQNRGVNYRTLETLFKMVDERKETFSINLSVSVLEVYNEQIRDLLATSPTSKKLEVRQAVEGAHHVPGIVEAKVENIKEVWNALQVGSNARAVGSNNVNEHSSRSHCMICIIVRAKNLMNGECTKSKLWLVDLAGSERLSKTDVQGERPKEAQNINRSLSALGDVISALAAKSSHIPYRNSKLTHLLQDSLGGDSKTLMYLQISPSEQDLGETLSSLNFATRVRGVELGPAKKQIDSNELQKLKLSFDKAKQESRSKDEALRKLEENVQSLEVKGKSKDQFYKHQQEKVNDLEGRLELKTQLYKQLEKQMSQLSDEVKEKHETCLSLQKKVNELEKKWTEHEHVESKTLQHKVKELENKLKEKTQEVELQRLTSQEKIKELENRLERQQENNDFLMLQQKIKGLEEMLREQNKQSECLPPLCSSEKSKATRNEQKAWSSAETPANRRILKSNNHSVSSQGSMLLKGMDSLHELRRKQDLQRRGGVENTAPIVEKKGLQSETSKTRQIDPSKAFARVMRTTTPFSLSRNRINREQAQGVKERDINTRVWSR